MSGVQSPLSPYREQIDDYVDELISSTMYKVDTDEEEEDTVIGYFTSNDWTRALFLGTSLLAIFVTIWHMIYAVDPILTGIPFRASHFLLMGALIFLSTFSSHDNRLYRWAWNLFTLAIIGVIVFAGVYVFMNYKQFWTRAGTPTQLDIIISTLLIFVTLEGARRVVGLPFFILGIGTLLYGVFGEVIPGLFGHAGLSWTRLATGVAVPNLNGIFGFLMDLSATIITMFIFFGIFLQYLGGSEFFGDLAMKIAGRLRSGPAQVAVLSSGFMGMMSGSAVANVAATGSFSIPLMERMGYDENFAGAVESVASTGGQIMPPIMGATAFILASIVGKSYFQVILAAAIPAVLYYVSVATTAHIRAVRNGFEPMDPDELVSLRSLIVRSYMFIPIVLIVLALYNGAFPLMAAWKGLRALIVFYVVFELVVNRDAPLDALKEAGFTLVKAFDGASRTMAAITITIAELAWIIRIFTMTGVFNKISSALVSVVGGNLLLLLILSALICIFFGFGVPTTAAYLFVALLAAPSMVQFGIAKIPAHLFVLYYAVLSAISPPVAAACLVATGMTKGNFLRICRYSIRFALPAYVLPFMWIYNPAIIGRGSPVEIAVTFLSMLLFIVLLVAFFEGFLVSAYTLPERVVSGGLAVALLVPLRMVRAVAIAVALAFVVLHVWRNSADIAVSRSIPR